jgi:hypothetical protein
MANKKMGRGGKQDGYGLFVQEVIGQRWSLAELRCDKPPTDQLLDLMDRLGLAKYESFVMRWENDHNRTR